MSAPSPMPSGWFPDPHGRYDHRWFNGTAWTADVSDDGQRFIDPTGAGPSPHGAAGAPGAPPAGQRTGNGSAVAAITLGLFAMFLAWVPVLTFIGIVLGVLALVFGIRGLRRSRSAGTGRGLAVTGIVTGSGALALSAVGIVLTVALFREVRDFVEPADHEASVVSCAIVDNDLVVEATITNRSGEVADFTLYAVIEEPDRIPDVLAEVDEVAPGETRTVELRRTTAALGECEARVVVHGPLPYGLEMERVN